MILTTGRRRIWMAFAPEFEKDTIRDSFLAHPVITIEDVGSISSIYLCDVERGKPMDPKISAIGEIDELITMLQKLREECVAFSEDRK